MWNVGNSTAGYIALIPRFWVGVNAAAVVHYFATSVPHLTDQSVTMRRRRAENQRDKLSTTAMSHVHNLHWTLGPWMTDWPNCRPTRWSTRQHVSATQTAWLPIYDSVSADYNNLSEPGRQVGSNRVWQVVISRERDGHVYSERPINLNEILLSMSISGRSDVQSRLARQENINLWI